MSGFRLIGVSGILLIASACATPISVTLADPITDHREVTWNARSADSLADP